MLSKRVNDSLTTRISEAARLRLIAPIVAPSVRANRSVIARDRPRVLTKDSLRVTDSTKERGRAPTRVSDSNNESVSTRLRKLDATRVSTSVVVIESIAKPDLPELEVITSAIVSESLIDLGSPLMRDKISTIPNVSEDNRPPLRERTRDSTNDNPSDTLRIFAWEEVIISTLISASATNLGLEDIRLSASTATMVSVRLRVNPLTFCVLLVVISDSLVARGRVIPLVVASDVTNPSEIDRLKETTDVGESVNPSVSDAVRVRLPPTGDRRSSSRVMGLEDIRERGHADYRHERRRTHRSRGNRRGKRMGRCHLLHADGPHKTIALRRGTNS